MRILSVKKIYLLFSLLNVWNYFLNKYCNLLFVAPSFPFWYFLHYPDHKKWKLRCGWGCEIIKRPAIKQSPTYQFFYSLIDCCMSVFFSFVIKAFVSFEKLIIFHRQAFVLYKNVENLKVLIKIFRQKLLVSSVILAFLDHLKLKFFFLGHSVANIECPPPSPSFQNLWIRPCCPL